MPIHRTLAFPVNNTDWRNARRNSDLRASVPTAAGAAARKTLTLSVDASWARNQIPDAACGLHSHESGDLLPVRVAASHLRCSTAGRQENRMDALRQRVRGAGQDIGADGHRDARCEERSTLR